MPLRKYAVWGVLTAPALWLLYSYAAGRATYGQTLSWSGQWAAWLFIVTLLASPLQRALGRNRLTHFLMTHRRAIGVAVFGYSVLHVLIFVQRRYTLPGFLADNLQPDMLTGWIAFLIFLGLAATSNNRSVKRLRRRWNALHRTTYLAGGLLAAHWILTAFDPRTAYIFTALVAALVVLRLINRAR